MDEMTLGQLRHRVTLRAPVPHENRVGPGKVTYRDAERVSAAIRGFKDFEIARFRQQAARCEREVVIRKRNDVGSDWQLEVTGTLFQIETVETDQRWTTLRVFKVGS